MTFAEPTLSVATRAAVQLVTVCQVTKGIPIQVRNDFNHLISLSLVGVLFSIDIIISVKSLLNETTMSIDYKM